MLTPHAEEYLEAIYKLGGQDSPVHLSSLAEYLCLSAASINEMVRRLEEQELVSYTPYHGVVLREDGLCQALAVIRRHRLWERFLTDILGLSWDVVHEEACKLEHAASEQITEKLAELLDNPRHCPHGKPMPPPGCELIPVQDAVPLSDLEVGQEGRVWAELARRPLDSGLPTTFWQPGDWFLDYYELLLPDEIFADGHPCFSSPRGR